MQLYVQKAQKHNRKIKYVEVRQGDCAIEFLPLIAFRKFNFMFHRFHIKKGNFVQVRKSISDVKMWCGLAKGRRMMEVASW